MQAVERWVEFEISGGRYALAVDAVAQVVALDRLHAVGESGWAGLLRLKEGTVPMADGASLIGEDRPRPDARARGLILRGRLPLGFTADDVLGVSAGSASPLISRVGLPLWAEAALPSRQGSAVILDGDRLWHSLRNGLEQRSDGGGFRLRPLPLWAPLFGPDYPLDGGESVGAPEEARVQPIAPIATPPADLDPLSSQESKSEAPVAAMVESRLETLEATEAVAVAVAQPAPTPFSVLVFGAGTGVDLAVPLEDVMEIGPSRTARPLPSGPPHLAGLLDWRGRLVPMVDLAERLGGEVGDARQTLYLKIEGRAAKALAVAIGKVVGPALVPALRKAPKNCGIPTGWVRGMARMGRRRLIVLEPGAMAVA